LDETPSGVLTIKIIIMKSILIATCLFCVVLFIIPVGGMCSTNPYASQYMYAFGVSELILIVTLIRFAILNRK